METKTIAIIAGYHDRVVGMILDKYTRKQFSRRNVMMSPVSHSALNIIEWFGVASSLAGSVLNARGHRCSFILWTLSALLLGVVAFSLGRPGWLALQSAGVAINLYELRNWQGNAPTQSLVHGN
ncbi:hypothetical protein [Geobacter hydrogenophilus]|uniref:hypothetical protein n=1 Tax=Geobacter hydrogenophilus TaxID=40983 RepID=UPI00249332A9|nr:hypothetical protein [Geobacter hydrogenophilus]